MVRRCGRDTALSSRRAVETPPCRVAAAPSGAAPDCRAVVEDDRGNTDRAVYTVKFAGWVYVLHCFQKKSESGIKTAKEDMDLIHARLKAAKQDFEAWQTKQGAR